MHGGFSLREKPLGIVHSVKSRIKNAIERRLPLIRAAAAHGFANL